MFELLKSVQWRSHVSGMSKFFITLSLMLASLGFNLHTRTELGNAAANNWVQRDTLEQAIADQTVLRENLISYNTYLDRGLIGEPRRLAWIEAFREVADALALPNVKFTLEESRVLQEGEDTHWQPGVAMRITPMRIEMQLAHEGDFYRLLDGLSHRAPGLFSVDNCKLDWQADDIYTLSLTRLSGACDLSWYTLFDITETWGGSS